MSGLYQNLLRSAIFKLDAEIAHGLSIKALKLGTIPKPVTTSDTRLSKRIAGLDFKNPVGMAAGFDKNAEVPVALLKLGFGFTEVGTITPLAQPGNPKPRIFRLPEDHAVINRLGFNNEGHDAALSRLNSITNRPGIIGVNIGANKTSPDMVEDYVKGIRAFYGFADYFTANISSPNTPGLRDLQARESLMKLLSRCMSERDKLAAENQKQVPLFLKIAPDLTEEGLDDIAAEVSAHKLDGVIVSNTTLSRKGLNNKSVSSEAGGLSGRPILERSNIVLAKMRQRLGDNFPIIGVGGVEDASSAIEKIKAGADLVQLYTGMVYQGPTIACTINRGLSQYCDQHKLGHIDEIRNTSVGEYASRSIPE
ncbi:MAG: quinone-dependent dihydroorotate dehydrogenase [Lentilitoribacter sp.]